ncbi:unnamed protein product, partial [Meganyctiphanes norvegica]
MDLKNWVWESRMDLTDVNAVASANKLPLVVTASDQQGLVRLFRYPSKGSLKKHRRYRGHSSHVTNVCWSYDDEFVISTGGADTAVCVWRLKKFHSDNNIEDEDPGTPIETDLVEHDIDEENSYKQNKDINSNKESRSSQALMRSSQALIHYLAEEMMVSNAGGAIESTMGKVEAPNEAHQDSSYNKVYQKLLKKLPALPTPTKISSPTSADETIIFCSGTVVGKLGMAASEKKLLYKDHDSVITALVVSDSEPAMVATAQIALMEEDTQLVGADVCLIHVWRPVDGTSVGVLRGGDEAVVTHLSFAPEGRFLASVADAMVLHIFNWVKGTHIASAKLATGPVVGICHMNSTTVCTLTPWSLLFCELIGNTMVVARGHLPPKMLPDNVFFTSVSVELGVSVFVGCSDGSVIEFVRRSATMRIPSPVNATSNPVDNLLLSEPLRLLLATGNKVVFATCRIKDEIAVRCYARKGTKKNKNDEIENKNDEKKSMKNNKLRELKYFSGVSVAAPTKSWSPLSMRIGVTSLVLGSHQGEPFLVMDLQKGSFKLVHAN